MKRMTTDCSTFSDLIRGDFVYVDKTGIILDLLRPPKAQYFMVCPHRFGKSLMIFTQQSIFSRRMGIPKVSCGVQTAYLDGDVFFIHEAHAHGMDSRMMGTMKA